MSKPFSLFDLSIAPLSYQDVVDTLDDKIQKGEKTFCVTLNLDILRIAFHNPSYHRVLQSADLIFADGMPIVWLSKLLKAPLPERVPGCDIVYELCKLSHKKQYKLFMLGAAPGVAQQAQEVLESTLPHIQVVGTYAPSGQEITNVESSQTIVAMINESQADVLFVALGAPKQENWIAQYYDQLNPSVMIPCGGSIDFIAGTQKKSPQWIGKLGFEWLYRLMFNPKKFFRRYLIDGIGFLSYILFHQVLLYRRNAKAA